jgi:hypothetical protein
MNKHTNDARMVHALVKKTAEEMAGAYYELAASRDNRFYKEWPSVRVFIRKNWKNFVVTARQVLASMLAKPSTPQIARDQIYDALQLDGNLPYSIQETQIVNVPH